MLRIWVLAGVAAACAVGSAAAKFGLDGLAAGLLTVAVVCFMLAAVAARVGVGGRT